MFNPSPSLNSLANPFKGSALSSRGLKPAANDIYFSVGKSYALDVNIEATIVNGIIDFGTPIGFPDFGVGYIVNNLDLIISKKYSESKWGVTTQDGSIPSNQDVTVDSLNAHSLTLDALMLELQASYAGLLDLVSINSIMHIALYKGETSAHTIVSGITADKNRYLHLYSPTDTSVECNSSQRHLHNVVSIYNPTTILMEDLILGGESDIDDIFIEADDSNITRCVFHSDKTFSNSVKLESMTASGSSTFSNNLITGFDIGLQLDSYNRVTNNTIHDCNVGVKGASAGQDVEQFYNNIVGATQTIVDMVSAVEVPEGNILSDGFALAGNNLNNTTVYYLNATSLDFRVQPRSMGDIQSVAYSSLSVNGKYDVYGNLLDNTMSSGAVHFTPEIIMSVGSSSSFPNVGTCSVTDGVATFVGFTPDDRIVSGVNMTIGASEYILYKKITDTTWYVTNTSGVTPADAADATYVMSNTSSSIQGFKNSVDTISTDLVTDDIKFTANLTYNDNGYVFDGTIADETRFLTVRTPYITDGVDAECYVSYRHRYMVDTTLPISSGDIEISCNSTIVDGMQMTQDNVSGTFTIIGGKNQRVTDNIFHTTKLVIDKYLDIGMPVNYDIDNVISGNVMFEVDGNAIEITNTGYGRAEASFVSIAGVSQIDINVDHAGVNTKGYRFISSQNFSQDLIYWTPGKVEISFSSTASTSFNPEIIGVPWGEISIGAGTIPELDSDLVNASVFNLYDQRYGNSLYTISNNTIVGAEYGILIESTNDGKPTNESIITDNVINNCTKDTIKPGYYLSGNTIASGNIVDDFNSVSAGGVKNSVGTAEFVDKYSGNFALRAFDSYKFNTNGVSVGAIPYAHQYDSVRYTSLGSSISLKGEATTYTLSDGVITFNKATGSGAGIGDVAMCDGVPYTLSDKASGVRWVVSSADGSKPIDASGLLSDITRHYDSITAFNADTLDLSAGGINRYNVYLYDDEDYTDALTPSITGLSSNNRLGIFVPYNTNTDCNSPQRHLGYIGDGVVFRASATVSEYTTITGITVDSSSGDGIIATAGNGGNIIEKCVIETSGVAISLGTAATPNVIAMSSVVAGTTGINDAGGASIMNNTVAGCVTGISSTSTVYNCIAYDCSTTCFSTGDQVNCISSDATAAGANSYANAVMDFIDPLSKDFTLKRMDWQAINTGYDTTGKDVNGYYVNTGIRNNPVVQDSYIGSDVVSNLDVVDIYYSASNDLATMKRGDTVTITNSIAVFADQQISIGMGAGDEVNYDGGTCLLKTKITDIAWIVADEKGLPVEDVSETPLNSIHHKHTTITTALAALKGVFFDGTNEMNDLSKLRLRFNVLLYNDEVPVIESFVLSGYIADEECYFNIETPVDNMRRCNTIQGHMGMSSVNSNQKTGDGVNGESVNSCYQINSLSAGSYVCDVQVDYTRISGLLIKGIDATTHGINIDADNCLVNRNVIYLAGNAINLSTGTTLAHVINNIVYASDTAIDTDGESFVMNNTVVNCTTGYKNHNDDYVANCIYTGTGLGFTSSVNVHNTISSDGSIDSSKGNQPYSNPYYSQVTNDGYARLWPVGTATNSITQGRGTRNVVNYESLLEYDVTGIIKRKKRFDIGAHRYVINAPQIVSLGSDIATNKTANIVGIGSNLFMDVYNYGGAFSVGQFNEPVNVEDVAAGDIVNTGEDPVGYKTILVERVNNRTWVIAYRQEGDGSFDSDLSIPVGEISVKQVSTSALSLGDAYNLIVHTEDLVGDNTYYTFNILKSYMTVDVVDGFSFFDFNEVLLAQNNTLKYTVSDGKDGLCNTSQRISYFRDDSTYKRTFGNGIASINGAYEEISGLYMPMATFANPADAINISPAYNCVIDSNFIFSAIPKNLDGQNTGYLNGINISAEYSYGRINIYNNIIDNAGDSAIRIDSGTAGYSLNLNEASYLGGRSSVCVINNTITDSASGVIAETEIEGYSPLITAINNLVRSPDRSNPPVYAFRDYAFYNRHITGNVRMVRNISSDNSSNMYTSGTTNASYVDIQFSEYPYSFFPNTIVEKEMSDGSIVTAADSNKIIDNAVIVSDKDCMPLSVDAAGNDRREDSWDNGALEMVRILGVGIMNSPYPFMNSDVGYSGDIDDINILYLRKEDPTEPGTIESGHKLPYVSSDVQFSNIDLLNAWVADEDNDANLARNLVVYAEGDQYFPGTFSFLDRSPKWVKIQTQPGEEDLGPSNIIYTNTLIDNTSFQKELSLVGLKVYSNDGATISLITGHPGYNTSDTDIPLGMIVTIINCVVQTDRNTIVASENFAVQAINSAIVYRNSQSTPLNHLVVGAPYVTDEDGLDVLTYAVNTMVLSYFNADLIFSPTVDDIYTSISDRVMSYNFGSGDYSIVGPSDAILYENTNPIFKEFIIVSQLFNIDIAMDYNFQVEDVSPAIDSGNDTYVAGILIDIRGNARRYLSGTVDIGPNEAKVHVLYIDTDNIFSIEQKKLYVNNTIDALQSADLDKTYYDAYDKFDNAGDAQEFVRESNILIELKTFNRAYIEITDKFNKHLVSMTAVLDAATKTLIVEKDQSYNSDFLATAFNDGRYRFHFDEIKGILSVYVHDTYDKGTSGKSNIVNNVRYSGTRMISG